MFGPSLITHRPRTDLPPQRGLGDNGENYDDSVDDADDDDDDDDDGGFWLLGPLQITLTYQDSWFHNFYCLQQIETLKTWRLGRKCCSTNRLSEW